MPESEELYQHRTDRKETRALSKDTKESSKDSQNTVTHQENGIGTYTPCFLLTASAPAVQPDFRLMNSFSGHVQFYPSMWEKKLGSFLNGGKLKLAKNYWRRDYDKYYAWRTT
jgi:hypothetical protein